MAQNSVILNACAGVLVGPAGRLHHPVERHVVDDDEPAHRR
jgi:hypothetical protein